MRITGGTLVGRKFTPPLSLTTRPMMDRVRQALFNILAHRDWGSDIGSVLEETYVLDAFCGTGALAFESVSWGATQATLFDNDHDAQTITKQNIADLKLGNRCILISADTLRPPKAPQACKLVFLAPPYRKNLIPPAMTALDDAGWFDKHPLIVAETAQDETLVLPPGFTTLLSRSYGEPMLHFITREK